MTTYISSIKTLPSAWKVIEGLPLIHGIAYKALVEIGIKAKIEGALEGFFRLLACLLIECRNSLHFKMDHLRVMLIADVERFLILWEDDYIFMLVKQKI